ncbi:hypothetical protein [Candidatus Mycoplasma haematohominis]|uniref:Uncharacterized protein n=1 Tax=Candidatus Mycoplasma haematohominis TaxID=1494318 RepID=A0A478FPI2_9MOLU|nr:hypothetical protein [Candidatus Mycoplasma haemohominis]GCE63281.1 hypothetical protein MHSWG343_02680 [Candidatus Mycoplasma haemohominis]
MQSAVADTTKEKKLLGEVVIKTTKEEEKESERLSTLFRKYKIKQYFWRNYKDTERLKSSVLIVVTTIAAIILGIIFCGLVL